MRFYTKSPSPPRKLGILAGSFNPPTIAHRELAHAAGYHMDEILWVLPEVFPHKEYFGATLEDRVQMLSQMEPLNATSIGVSERGLFVDIAREAREKYSHETEIYLLCGRDAAERILTWDYGREGVLDEMFGEFEMMVASRAGEFTAPAKFRERIHPLGISSGHDHVSSTEVRHRIARGEPWEHLVPEEIAERIREIYS